MMMNIKLRKLELRDINDEYCNWYKNDDGHLDYFTGSNRVFSKATLIDDYNHGVETGRWFYYLIEDKDSNRIGNVKIGPIDIKNATSDLVCLIGNRDFLGKGVAAKAIALANDIAFRKHGIRRLHGGMYKSNVPSIKAYTRAGWFVECEMEGFYLIDGKVESRVCVACLNPDLFKSE